MRTMQEILAILNSDVVKNNQTVIAALIATIGALIGYFVNSILNRRRDDRLRRIEANAVRSIVKSEIFALSMQANQILEIFKHLDAMEAPLPREALIKDYGLRIGNFGHTRPYFFKEMIDKLPLVGAKDAQAVTSYYHLFYDVFQGVDELPNMTSPAEVSNLIEVLKPGLEKLDKGGKRVAKALGNSV